MKTPDALPDDIDQLKAMILQLQEAAAQKESELKALEDKYQALLEQFRVDQKNRFGRKSESHQVEPEEFNEAEAIACEPPDKAEAKATKKPKRQSLPKDLPREQVVHDLTTDDKRCDCCGGELHKIGEEKTEKLEFIPASIKVIEHIRPKYACAGCEKQGSTNQIKIAPLPAFPIPKSIATPSLLSQVITAKYLYALPLYRQEGLFAQAGIDLSRKTLSDWVLKSAELLNPVYERLQQILRQQAVLHADETPVNVIKEDRAQCYMWVYTTAAPCAGDTGMPEIVLYDYQRSRERKHITNFLGEFSGYLQVDGYAGYENTGTTLVGCWAHARRKFKEAHTAQPKGKVGKADWALNHIQKLYRIEQQIKELSADERYTIRQQQSKPLLDQFRQWLEKSTHLPPASKIGKAVQYSLNQWPKLLGYLEDGRLNIDNNRAERAVKPFVLGRKNWLFNNTGKGAKASATLYSLVGTAVANDLVVYDYLNELLTELPALKPGDSLDHLLPWNIKLP